MKSVEEREREKRLRDSWLKIESILEDVASDLTNEEVEELRREGVLIGNVEEGNEPTWKITILPLHYRDKFLG